MSSETPLISGPEAPAPVGSAPLWTLRLLGGFDLQQGDRQLTGLPSRAATALLARLAIWPGRAHGREELVELLWPGVALDAGRNRLRQTLSTLKSLLEGRGSARRPVLLADRISVRALPGTIGCDVPRFKALLREGRIAQARALYRGELLPGFYDEWIGDERTQLAAMLDRCHELEDAAVRALPPPPSPAPPDLAGLTIPHYLTRLYGAERQGRRLRALIGAQRLVTLVGPGGCGKTRLAVELARELRAEAALHRGASTSTSTSTGTGTGGAQAADGPASFAPFDLVVFVPLVGCHTTGQLVDTLLGALPSRGSTGGGSADGLRQLQQVLGDRRALLVLDNFEQLDDAATALVARLAATLPGLHQLVTSRRPLGLDGERELQVDPLELPSADSEPEAAAANPAVALFVDRARAVRPDFTIGPGEADAVAGLVRALGGMPLAIELAASRARSFTPAELLARFSGPTEGLSVSATPGLDLLVRSGPRGAEDPRHASMLSVIEWSWHQLRPVERALLAGLTVFAGGCSVAAAAAVCAEAVPDSRLQIDALQAQGLLRLHDPGDGALRIALAEPLREFAAAQLGADSRRALRSRHRRWWVDWAESFGATPPLGPVRRELSNIVAALTSAVEDDRPEDAVRIALALRAAFNEILLPAGGIAQLALALQRVHEPGLQSRGHSLLGMLCFEAGDGAAALRHAELGLALSDPRDPAQRARALHALASVRWRVRRDADPAGGLPALLDEAAALAQTCGDLGVGASVDALRAFVANVADRDFARGEQLHRRALAQWERLGNRHTINGGSYKLAICAFNGHRWFEALERLDAVCATARQDEEWEQLSDALNVRGNTLAEQRDWPRALAAYQDCVRIAWGTMETHALAYGLWNLPQTLAHLRRPVPAARL